MAPPAGHFAFEEMPVVLGNSIYERSSTPPGFPKARAIGSRLIKHARYYRLLLAESHLTRRLFGSMVRRIDALALATG
jgi:hypothetical protein